MIYKTTGDHPPGSTPIISACWPQTGTWDDPPKNSVQWSLDGAGIYFSHAAEAYVAAVDGSRLRRIATAWTEAANSGERVGRDAPFHVALGGARLVYATCEFSEPLRGPYSRPWDHQQDLVVVSLDGTQRQRLTATRIYESHPAWSPDGAHIAYVADADPHSKVSSRLYLMQADGANRRRLKGDFDFVANQPPAWSPDGRWLAVTGASDTGGRFALHLVSIESGGDFVRLSDAVSGASWSPDGQRLAFAKPDGAEVALYTIAADGSDARRLATIVGWQQRPGRQGRIPTQAWINTVAWSPDGSKILYSCGALEICVVTPDGTPVSAAPLSGVLAAWSPDGLRIATLSAEYAPLVQTMAPDGSDVRVLVMRHEDGPIALGPRPLEGPVDVTGCADGRAVPQPEANPGLVRDCETLLVVQARLAGAGRLDWATDRPITEWEGVVLGDWPLRVRRLTLVARGLTGVIPPELTQLTQLARLDLSQNILGGVIPPELGALSELRVLNLYWNLLGGAIPVELAELTKLEDLNLGRNYLTGTVPPELGNLTKLGLVTLRENQLTGCIPPTIGRRVVDRSYLGLPYCETE